MKSVQRRTVIASALGLVGFAKPVFSQEVLRIGVVASLTGPASYIGEDMRATAELLRDQINASGGINGRKIETITYDDASDPTKAVIAIRRLHDQDRVLAVVGPAISGNALAAIPTSEAAKVVQIVPGASGKVSNPVKRYVYQSCNTDVQSIALALGFLKERKVTKVAMLSDSTGYGVSGKEELERQAKGGGFQLVAMETFGPTDTDMTAQLVRIKASGAQAVLVWNATPTGAIVVKNFRQIGLDAIQIHSTAFQSTRLLALAGDAADGVYVTGHKLAIADRLPASDPQKKVITEYIDAFTKRFGRAPTIFGALTQDGLTMLLKVMQEGASSREAIRDALENISSHVGAAGMYKMSPTDHNGFLVESMRMLRIEKGGFSPASR